MTQPVTEADVREGYDGLAQVYFDFVGSEMQHVSVVRAGLRFFAELVKPGATTLDAGCGPGHISAFLASEGLDVSGIDISPTTIDLAAATFPDINFAVASLAELPQADSSLDAVVARHSIIHTHPDQIGDVFAEFARVLRPKGRLFVSFFATTTPEEHGRPFDHQVCTAYQLDASNIADVLTSHGLHEEFRIVRQPRENERQMPHAMLYARLTS